MPYFLFIGLIHFTLSNFHYSIFLLIMLHDKAYKESFILLNNESEPVQLKS